MKTYFAKFAAVAAVAAIALPGVASAGRGGSGGNHNQAGRCTGTPFQRVHVSDPVLDTAEKARAEKVDRNNNDYVCRKDISGQGGGNTGSNSNIKDDKI